ncbi:helix-turn-helix transcriptional regulator [Sunxiuqinia sp. A32]|uniref:helix-turn-helix transcriptional regulator n=1 Tax=Sunxiuqinia sp. A32 TaxID=3461496 RepID=UPI0040459DE1
MKLRIKELCSKKNTSVQGLAKKLNITRETLSRQISGNPTLETLSKIADALEVEISELFTDRKITGSVRIGDEMHAIDSIEDIEELLKELKGR